MRRLNARAFVFTMSRRPPHPCRISALIPAALARARRKRIGAQETEEGLQRRPEIILLAYHDVEAFPHHGREADGGGVGDRTRRDAAVGPTRPHRLRDVRSGRAGRIDRPAVTEGMPGAME